MSSSDFIDFLAQFNNVYNLRSDEGERKISHFKSGLIKLEQINAELKEKMSALKTQREELEVKNNNLEFEYKNQMQLKIQIQERQSDLEKENNLLKLKNEDLRKVLGEVQNNLESAEAELEASKDKILKEIKSHVAEVKSYKKGSAADFFEVIMHFSSLLFKQSYKDQEEAKKEFIKNSMALTR